MRQALVLVDIQNDYFPGGKMELVGMDEASANAHQTLELFRARSLPVYHVQHLSDSANGTFFLPDTEGVKIHELVQPGPGEPTIQKRFPNAFKDTPLNQMLRSLDVEEVVVCGAMTHMCIDTTVRAAFDLGFDCLLVADACATKDMEFEGMAVEAPRVQAAFMAALSGTFAKVIKANQLEGHLT